jgi:hypothetical protein
MLDYPRVRNIPAYSAASSTTKHKRFFYNADTISFLKERRRKRDREKRRERERK